MAKFKLLEQPPEKFTAPVVSAAVEKGDPVKFTTGGITAAGDGDRVDAFTLEAGAVDAYVQCGRGSFRLMGRAGSGVDFALGDDAYLNASGQLDTGSTGNTAVGEVIGQDPSTGGIVEIKFDPLGATTHA